MPLSLVPIVLGSIASSGGESEAPVLPVATVGISPSSLTEGSAFTVTVTLTGGVGPASVAYAITGDTDDISTALTGTISVASLATTGNLTVNTIGDGVDEANANFTLTISSPTGCTIGTPSAANGTINDDDVAGFAPLAVDSRVVFFGNGLVNLTRCKGVTNFCEWALFLSGQRLRYAVGGHQGKSGENMSASSGRVSFTTAQKPDVIVVQEGHNDTILGTGYATAMPQFLGILNGLRSGNPDAWIIVTATAPSTETEANRTAAWADQQAWVTTDTAAGNRSRWVPVPSGFSETAGADTDDGVHFNESGARKYGVDVAAVLTSITESVADSAVLSVTAEGQHGANLDAEFALPGTSGSKTGTPTPTGNVATGRTVANGTTTGATVACSKTSSDSEQTIEASGSVAAEGNLEFNNANITFSTVTPGQYLEFLQTIDLDDGAGGAPVGVRSWGLTSSLDHTCMGPFIAEPQIDNNAGLVSGIMRTRTKPQTIVSAVFGDLARVRLATGTPDVRWRITKPIARLIDTVAYAAPAYLGNDTIKATAVFGNNLAENSRAFSGTGVAGGGTLAAATLSFTSGNTINFTPGCWSGGNLAFNKRLLKNGVEISGALASGWSWTSASITTGDVLTLAVSATNSFGTSSEVTQAYTVTVS